MEKRDSMSKVKIKAFLENRTEKEQHQIETIGIQNGNCVMYQDNAIQMILTIMGTEIHMRRVQNEDILDCHFIETLTTDGIYDIKSVNITFPVKINTKKLKIEKQEIVLEYEMTLAGEAPKTFYYQLAYEVIL